MKVKNFLKSIKDPHIQNLIITDIADDSRFVKKGSIFFVIEKPNFDIFSVLKKIEKKVKIYAVDLKNKDRIKKMAINKPVIYLKGIENHFYQAVKKFYKPKLNLKIIGITGTNGKTSTAYFLHQLFKKNGKKTAFFGTIGYFIGSSKYKINHTTADFLTLYKMIKKVSQKKINYLIMEVSSHSIAQERIKGLNFTRCVFTNLSRDHLDYHKTMDSYFKIKKSFFFQSNCYSVVNNNCLYGKKILSSLNKKISYGVKSNSDYQAKNIKLFKNRTKFDLVWNNRVFPVSTKLSGYHNILNILAALASAHSLRFSLDKLVKTVPSLKRAKGRFQEIAQNIFIDYAHTPEGLEHILSSLQDIGYEKIISVFGCGGQRDKGKRKIMGKISSQLADVTIITSDNPRGEDPSYICKQIKKGCLNNRFKVIINRKEAIRKAILLYRNKKEIGQKVCVLVAGKGHEDCQILKNKKVPFQDSKTIKSILKNN
ncbi:MAG: UDP-N-acetylmuramoyl-L-alanyl-D-glutamate--2,6-diaminopimelate ligase [Candidatus Omnitrophica bacterium]|nr:UDP-N-acetylmuramoyl-L-alanyl-D-glutamate--2,6-diaminopimelate ligase [Candidatus Omnitrophota bacterium]MCF7894541.1 UDP-N-acetylmuramoyl-L-alanyl-D-glutamate--2,6-diaminopimelate ligase [Candidatus Omnitrophota bacterium]